ncbi:hypothetical protein, partial [Acinetobacter baumannii]|uniref:hypothetical protein n=1 Tax=Acinetobacter baumannii TaxID=470 RepID=UPI00339ADF86
MPAHSFTHRIQIQHCIIHITTTHHTTPHHTLHNPIPIHLQPTVHTTHTMDNSYTHKPLQTNKQHTPFTQPRSHLITNHRWQTQTALITPTSTTKQTPNQTPTDQLSRAK